MAGGSLGATPGLATPSEVLLALFKFPAQFAPLDHTQIGREYDHFVGSWLIQEAPCFGQDTVSPVFVQGECFHLQTGVVPEEGERAGGQRRVAGKVVRLDNRLRAPPLVLLLSGAPTAYPVGVG